MPLQTKTRFARILTLAFAILPLFSASAKETKVACIGNSITFGFTLQDPVTQSYPAQLQELLGPEYKVGRFGKSGATLLNKGHRPYMQQQEFKDALDFKPDIAIIHLGINDTDPRNWPNFNSEFVTDYLSLIDSLRAVNPEVRIIIANLSPIRATHKRFKSGTRDWRLQIRETIGEVAQAANAELIDFEEPLRDRQDLLPDALHPTVQGSHLLAQTAYSAITGNYGGLKLPEIWSDGMIIQRNTPIKLSGTANANDLVKIKLDNRTHTAKTDNRGQWSVILPPLATGPEYSMTISTDKDTIEIHNILAGEVWLASGQSNMAFKLRQALNGKEDLKNSYDPELKFFSKEPRVETNNVEWPDSIVLSINNLDYYRPATWTAASPENSDNWSAVAYYFARQLRDSLKVPVGIISNAIGGSPTEAWIDINTLEEKMPEILQDWRHNDYVQPWAQGRANLNTAKGDKNARHPYEPSYLFSTGIRPLGSLPLAGVLWYQGESNAHNIEIHEQLFTMLIDSWRNWFDAPQLPVVFAQLSSIDRPSWPQFRDSQRRMAQDLKYVSMAVTSDVGDSLDVHPRDKATVGNRLAKAALHEVYGYENMVCSGPSPKKAIFKDGTLLLTMYNAQGMRLLPSSPSNSFEIAEIDGIYYPAETNISNDTIMLKNPNVKKPRYIRYGWQPFTRAQLVNDSELPASTFKIEVTQLEDIIDDNGIEHGVSGCFFGKLKDKFIRAGGSNFPADPLGANSEKKYYSGIYATPSDDINWSLIGILPEPLAYGATISLDDSLILIGGTSPSESKNTVYQLSIDDEDNAILNQLPSLPIAMDNMAATCVGHKIYVIGGNANGTPSRTFMVLDLDNIAKGWQRLKDFPGNKRLQPVAASATNAAGEDCIYIWGGFAGRHKGYEPTLNTDGLCYNIVTRKWTSLPSPTDANGEDISLGGGTCTALADGTILAAGGVNKDVFLSALQSAAPDYIMHPIPWYRFNSKIMKFNPKTESWSLVGDRNEVARAGAAMIAPTNNEILIYGGELKPRIRTAETSRITF